MTPTGIEPAIFRFVAQNLNHCATSLHYLYSMLLIFCCLNVLLSGMWSCRLLIILCALCTDSVITLQTLQGRQYSLFKLSHRLICVHWHSNVTCMHVTCQHVNQRSLLLFTYEVLLYLDRAVGSRRLRGQKSARLVLLKTWVCWFESH